MNPIRREVQIGMKVETSITFEGFTKTAVIYGIKTDERVVYVGSTTRSITERIRGHVTDAENGSLVPIHAWMRGHAYRFTVALLEHVDPDEMAEAERRWIKNLSPGLLNQTIGGPGCVGHKFSDARNWQISMALRKGSQFNCEVCQTEFWRKPRDIRKGHTRFCSRGCYQTWQVGKPKIMPARAA